MLYKLADVAVRSGWFRCLDDHQYGLLAAAETDERLTLASVLENSLIGIILLLGIRLILPTAIILGLVWQPFWRLFDLKVVYTCSFLNLSPCRPSFFFHESVRSPWRVTVIWNT